MLIKMPRFGFVHFSQSSVDKIPGCMYCASNFNFLVGKTGVFSFSLFSYFVTWYCKTCSIHEIGLLW